MSALQRLVARALGKTPTVRPVLGMAAPPAAARASLVAPDRAPVDAAPDAPLDHTVRPLPPKEDGLAPRADRGAVAAQAVVEDALLMPAQRAAPAPRRPPEVQRPPLARTQAGEGDRTQATVPAVRDEAPLDARPALHSTPRDAATIALAPAHRVLPSAHSAEAVPAARARIKPPGTGTAQATSASREQVTEVHVTIGRVELTAVQETPRARPQPARGPAPLSLDEYLARRGTQGR